MNIIDRYIIRQILATFVFAMFALCIIFVIVNLMESLDEFIDKQATFKVIISYYLYYLPEITKILTPVAMLISVLFTIGKLSNLSEIIAMKSGGMSLYRLITPLLTVSLLISLGQLYFNGWIVPKANHAKFDIEAKYFADKKSGGPIFNLYFRDNPLRNVIIKYYDETNKTGNNIAIEDYSDEKKPRLVKRIEAEKLTWDSSTNKWKLSNGVSRIYNETGIIVKRIENEEINLRIGDKQIKEFKRSTDEMTYPEFKEYLDLLNKGGKDVRKQVIEYYSNYAFPFANIIVVIFGVPFASVKKKGGIAIQIAAAMVISFSYLVFTKLGQSIGYSYMMNPILAGWIANLIFLGIGLINLFKTKT